MFFSGSGFLQNFYFHIFVSVFKLALYALYPFFFFHFLLSETGCVQNTCTKNTCVKMVHKDLIICTYIHDIFI